jgi:hypothetical protein
LLKSTGESADESGAAQRFTDGKLWMTDHDAPTDIGPSLDTSSAMLRAESDQLEATLHALVMRLSSVPSLKMVVSHRHGKLRRLIGDLPYINDLHRRTDPIEKVLVTLGDSSYWLHCDGQLISCGRDSAPLDFSVWASALFDGIARQNLVNHESLVALRQLVELDQLPSERSNDNATV